MLLCVLIICITKEFPHKLQQQGNLLVLNIIPDIKQNNTFELERLSGWDKLLIGYTTIVVLARGHKKYYPWY